MPRFSRLALVLFALAWPGLAQAAGTTQTPTETAIFAGGCFWCMDAAFRDLPVEKVVSGYTGGHVANPTYEQVSSGTTGHVEAIEVVYDPAKVSYDTLLKHFWENVDPTDPSGQFRHKGSQYGAGVFFTSPAQEKAARASLQPVQAKFSQPLAAFIRKAEPFYPAEGYHQDYAAKNALRYKLYETGCGREKRLEELHTK